MKEYMVDRWRDCDCDSRESRLNELARDDWRLIAVDDHIAYLERNIPEESKS